MSAYEDVSCLHLPSCLLDELLTLLVKCVELSVSALPDARASVALIYCHFANILLMQ